MAFHLMIVFISIIKKMIFKSPFFFSYKIVLDYLSNKYDGMGHHQRS